MDNIPNISLLIGINKDIILSMANLYKSLKNNIFYLEINLKDRSGIDLSVQYRAIDFLNKNFIISEDMKSYNELFNGYANILSKYNDTDVRYTKLYLESDISIDNAKEYSIFTSIPRNNTENILIGYLDLFDLINYKDSLFKIMNASKDLILYYLGLMYSREIFSIRCAYYLRNNNISILKKFLIDINYTGVPEDDLYELKFLENNNISMLIDIDIYNNKSIGNILGLELCILINNADDQKSFLYNEDIKRVFQLMKKWNIVNNSKLDIIKQCIFYSSDFNIRSVISHFKLRWDNGIRLPAKAYIEVRNCN